MREKLGLTGEYLQLSIVKPIYLHQRKPEIAQIERIQTIYKISELRRLRRQFLNE